MNLTIGQLAKAAEVNIETIRYYERCGLIEQPVKPASGYRRYKKIVLDRLRFIRRAKSLGFNLDEVKNLLQLSEGDCDDVLSMAQHKLSHVKGKLDDLRRLEAVLGDLVKQCQVSADKAHCPIIESLIDD